MIVAAIEMKALKLWSVLHERIAVPLFSFSLPKYFSIRCRHSHPAHLRVEDCGKVEGNVVFSYLDAFDPDTDGVDELKARYRRGGLGDSTVKGHLDDVLQAIIAPIREKRADIASSPEQILEIVRKGTVRPAM